MWQALEAPADGERCRRPLDSLPRIGILAGGEFDEEATAELVGACPRGGAEIAGGAICGSAAQSHLPAPESQREHEARLWSDPPSAVGLDEEVPTIGAELEAVVSDAADLGATAPMVEPQLARHDDAHLERRALGRVRDALGDRLVRLRSEPDEEGEAGEQHQRDNDQRCLHGFLHATQDHR